MVYGLKFISRNCATKGISHADFSTSSEPWRSRRDQDPPTAWLQPAGPIFAKAEIADTRVVLSGELKAVRCKALSAGNASGPRLSNVSTALVVLEVQG